MKKFTPSARHGWANRADLSCIPDSARYNAVRVLHSLAGHANQETLITNVGIDKIAEEIAVSTRTVKRCLPRLEQAGLIVLKRIRRRGNVYMLLIGDMDEATKERVTDVFRSGKNLPQIAEFISDILLSLRDEQKSGSLSDTTPRSKCHHGVTLTGSREQGK